MRLVRDKKNLWAVFAGFVGADQGYVLRELLACRLWEE